MKIINGDGGGGSDDPTYTKRQLIAKSKKSGAHT